jgi:hypothetical protein
MLRRTGGGPVKTTRLRVTLRDVEPAVARVLDVSASTTLPELHLLLQAAFGWWNYHLHQFITADERRYGTATEAVWEDQINEATARLRDLGERFTYWYDFGDDWMHDVEVLGRGAEKPGCVGGEGTCPPEDCGGPGGYEQLLATLADPSDSEHQHMRDWVGNRLRPFDREHVNDYVVRMVGVVPATVRLLLDLVSDGVRLTPAGRLPRVVVREVQQRYPGWYPLGRPASIEDDLLPLLELHWLLRRAGLLRLRNGVLAPTKAAGDDLDVVRRLRGAFEADAFTATLVEVTAALLACRGPLPSRDLGRELLPEIGNRWTIDGRQITADDARSAAHRVAPLMQALDLVAATRPAWSAGPSARSLLPGATLRAEVWSIA